MAELFTTRYAQSRVEPFAFLGRLVLLTIPSLVLLGGCLRAPDTQNPILWFGIGFQTLLCLFLIVFRSSASRSMAPSIIIVFLTALTWTWFGDVQDDWYNHLAKAILIVIPLVVFGHLTLHESGATALRRANVLAQRLANRQDWPADLAGCRALPEVKAFRAALAYDASPALALLQHPRSEVRVAALAALDFHKGWRPGQAELILTVARNAELPILRTAAVTALGNVDDRPLIEMLAQFLHDHSHEVRRATLDALLWDSERRWPWLRFPVRRILADPLFSHDGPLLPSGQTLPEEAVKDLTAWCAEKGILSARAAQTLAAHYNRALTEQLDPALVGALKQQLSDGHTSAVLRLELGKLLQSHQELDLPLLAQLLDPGTAAPLRLIAAETILSEHPQHELRSTATAALRDLARLPNREMALATADIVQRRLGIDVGLGLGQPLPSVQSRQAAEITRRVTGWANQHADDEDLERSGMPSVRTPLG